MHNWDSHTVVTVVTGLNTKPSNIHAVACDIADTNTCADVEYDGVHLSIPDYYQKHDVDTLKDIDNTLPSLVDHIQNVSQMEELDKEFTYRCGNIVYKVIYLN